MHKTKVNLEEDLRINNFFPNKKNRNFGLEGPLLFVLGIVSVVAIALEAGIITMLAAK